jgi:hypothetical protein
MIAYNDDTEVADEASRNPEETNYGLRRLKTIILHFACSSKPINHLKAASIERRAQCTRAELIVPKDERSREFFHPKYSKKAKS